MDPEKTKSEFAIVLTECLKDMGERGEELNSNRELLMTPKEVFDLVVAVFKRYNMANKFTIEDFATEFGPDWENLTVERFEPMALTIIMLKILDLMVVL